MSSLRPLAFSAGLFLLALALAGCGSPEDREARYLSSGDILLAKGDYEKARLEYKNAARLMPADPEPGYKIGLIDESEGDVRSAYEDFDHARQQNPRYKPALLKLAHYDLAGGRVDEAQNYVALILQDSPGDAEAHALRAAVFLRQKNFPATEREARLALQTDENNLTAAAVLVGLYAAEDNRPKAARLLSEGITRHPDELSLLFLKASLYQNWSDFDQVADAYRAIFRLRPHELVYRLDLARILESGGKIDEGEATLRAAILAFPQDWDLKHRLIFFLAQHRGAAVAQKEVQNYIDANPHDNHPAFWLADIYVAQKETAQAAVLLSKIASASPDSPDALNAHLALARLDFMQGDKASAQNLVTEILARDPGNADALFIRANLAASQRLYPDAVADLRAIIRDQPGKRNALALLAEILLAQNHTDLAIDMLEQLLESSPSDEIARVRVAQLYAVTGNYRHALEELAVATRQGPAYAPAWESTARIAIAAKDFSTATAAIEKLSSLPGQQRTATFLQGEIAAANRQDDATTAFSGTTAVKGTDQPPYLARAQLCLKKGNAAQALALLKTAEDAAPADIRAAMMEGNILTSLGRYLDAVALYRQILSRHPDSDLAANNFAAMVADHDFQDKAMLETAKTAASRFMNSSNPAMLDTLGWVDFRLGDLDNAVLLLARAVNSKTAVPQPVYYHYGLALKQAGRIGEARKALQKAIEGHPDYPEAQAAKNLMNDL